MKFLVIDDEREMQELITELLDSLGYESVCTDDPLEAKKLVMLHNFNYVMTDIGMPKLNGLELMKSLREIRPDTKFICVSGFRDMLKEEIKEYAELTFQKPIDADSFLAEISKLTRS